MPTNVAKLGITVDANGAVTEVNRFNQALDKTIQASERVTATTKLQDQELRKLAEISRSAGDYYGKQYQSLIQLSGGQERFLQIQRQIDEEMRVADQVTQQYTVSTNKAAEAATRKGVSINSLRSPLSTLAANLTGLNPQIAQLTGLLGSLATGSAITVGVLAGLAAIGAAYEQLTEKSRKLEEETKNAIDRLRQLRDEQNKSGQLPADIEKAKTERDNLQSSLDDRAKRQASGPFQEDLSKEKKRVDELNDYIKAGEEELRRRRIQSELDANALSLQLEQNTRDEQKKTADEFKQANAEAIRQLQERIRLINSIVNLSSLPTAVATIDAKNFVPEITVENTLGTGYGTNRQRPDYYRDQSALNAGKQIVATDQANQKIFADERHAVEDAAKGLSGLDKAARTASQALEYYLVSKIGGGGVGASLGAAVGKGALEDYAGGFAKTALGSAVFGPVAAGLGAAVGGALDKLDLFGTHAREAAEALKQMQDAAHASALAFKIDAQGYETAQDKYDEELRAHLERVKEYLKLPAGSERNQLIGDEYKYFDQKVARIGAADAESKRYANEDLDVRTLRAQGKDKEADAKDLANRQQAEYAKAVADGMSDEYLARLKEVQSIEKTKAAMDELTKSAVNAVQGYRYQATIYQNSPSRTFGTGIDDNIYRPPITPVPYPSTTSASVQSGTSSGSVADVYLDGEKVGTIVLKGFQKKSQRKFGTTERWSEIQ